MLLQMRDQFFNDCMGVGKDHLCMNFEGSNSHWFVLIVGSPCDAAPAPLFRLVCDGIAYPKTAAVVADWEAPHSTCGWIELGTI